MSQKLTPGQVWKRKGTEERICIGSVNVEERKVWVNGYVDAVDPIISWEYLSENYEVVAGWSI